MKLAVTTLTTTPYTVDAEVTPTKGALEVLSREEVERLRSRAQGGQYERLRRCALAILTAGCPTYDDARTMLELYPSFSIRLRHGGQGLKIDLTGAPAAAFVDGQIIRGIGDLLFAAIRDLAYQPTAKRKAATNEVFEILRNARLLTTEASPNVVVCWGGHSIPQEEYLYTKEVGYQLGLRGLDICTGCGPGAMKGPMKGAAIAHAKQRRGDNRYIGLTEPGIIAAESPNAIVNHLVVLPDIEKRLEAFVRLGHGFIVFPGGVGTAEEIFYLLGLLLAPENAGTVFPLVLTGPESARAYFEQIDRFLGFTLGEVARQHYRIVIGDPVEAARAISEGIKLVEAQRMTYEEPFYFNWRLTVPADAQVAFKPTHQAMADLKLESGQPVAKLAADLRRAFSGIVAGNVKEEGLAEIEKHGPFLIHGEIPIMESLDALLRAFVAQGRMKLPGSIYTPCYEVAVN